jgi:hypothetical protein
VDVVAPLPGADGDDVDVEPGEHLVPRAALSGASHISDSIDEGLVGAAPPAYRKST